MNLNDIINEIIESDDMKQYLCEHISDLPSFKIRDMIAYAHIPLKRKYEIFKEIINDNPNEYYNTFKFISNALEALNNKENNVYDVCIYNICEDSNEHYHSDSELFINYDKALQYAINSITEFGNQSIWAIIVIWKIKDNDLIETYNYCLTDRGICYVCATNNLELENSNTWMNADLNLPVPFKPGDHIITDGYPFAKVSEATIVEIGDNWDCCSVVIHLPTGENVPLKHSFGFQWDICSLSPLYRIRKIE